MDKISFYAPQFDEEKFIQELAVVSFRVRAKFICDRYLYNKDGSYKCAELYIAKKYPGMTENVDEEYFHLYTNEEYPEVDKYLGKSIKCLGSTVSGTESKHLALEFCIEYLRHNSNHIIVSGDNYFYTLEHLLKAREKEEYFWCYKSPEELLKEPT